MKKNGRYIGTNHTIQAIFGGIDSSFSEAFTDEEVLIGAGLDYIPCIIGNIDETYKMLFEKIGKESPQTFVDMCACIFSVVNEYFGDFSNISERMNNYHDLDLISDGASIGKVSDLKGKNAAMCVERAMLSQNLLNFLGFKSFYKSSGILSDGKPDVHAYNLVENNGDCFIFDATIPSVINDSVNPLICEIPREVYEEMSSSKARDGYSVDITHFNPLKNEERRIVYDAGRRSVYEAQSLESVKKL